MIEDCQSYVDRRKCLPCRENLGVGSWFRRVRNDFHDATQDDDVDLQKKSMSKFLEGKI